MVSMYKLNDLKKCLEGHDATIEPIGKAYVSRRAELKAARGIRKEWAEKTQQSWVKHKAAERVKRQRKDETK